MFQHSPRRHFVSIVLAGSVICLAGASAADQPTEPLSVQINQLLQQDHVGPDLPLCSDAEFLRRIYLDLTGRIPTSAEARAFLDDQSPGKRAALVDRLLAGSEFVRQMATVFDIMLMERRADKHVKADEWQQYLLASFRENKPFNQLAGEILGADGVDAAKRAPAKFYLERELQVDRLTRDVGRTFFGVDLECAQCHDHPIIDDYLQSDYYGIYAFLNRVYLFQPDSKKPAVLGEKAEGDVTFKSVFTGEEGATRPRLPGGDELDEPTFAKGQEYITKPDDKKKVRGVPKYSRRARLGELASAGDNRAFNENIANRLWAHMLGRGLVDPVDLHHSDNPPSRPALLRLLAEQFVAMKYDVKSFLREVALSDAYQRPLVMPELSAFVVEATAAKPRAAERVAALTAELKTLREGLGPQQEQLAAAETSLAEKSEAQKKLQAALAAAENGLEAAKKAAGEAQQKLAGRQSAVAKLNEAAAKIDEAIKQLGEDKELQQTLVVFRSRAQQYNGEIPALAKAVETLSAAATEVEQKLVAAKQTADAAAKTLAAAQSEQQKLAAEIAASHARLQQAEAELEGARQRDEFLQQLLAHQAQKQQLDAVAKAAATAQTAVAKAQADIAANQQIIQSQTAAIDAARKAETAASTALDGAKQQLTAKEAAAKLLAESLALAEQAGDDQADKEIQEAAAKLKARLATLKSETAQLAAQASQHDAAAKQAAAQLQDATAKLNGSQQALAAAQKQFTAQTAESQKHAAQLDSLRPAVDNSYAELGEAWSRRFDVAVIAPLSPEEFAWSAMQATGMVARQVQAETEALDKKEPLSDQDKTNAAKLAERGRKIEQAVFDKLKGNVTQFVNLYGAGAGQPQNQFFATVDQALFFANGSQVQSWLKPGGGNLTDRLAKLDDPQQFAEELYLSVFTRRPTAAETADVADYLKSREDKAAAAQEMAWALITSAEFRFER